MRVCVRVCVGAAGWLWRCCVCAGMGFVCVRGCVGVRVSLCLSICLSGWVSGCLRLGLNVSASSATTLHIVLPVQPFYLALPQLALGSHKERERGCKACGDMIHGTCETQARGCDMHKGRERRQRESIYPSKKQANSNKRHLEEEGVPPGGREQPLEGCSSQRKRSLPQSATTYKPEKWPSQRNGHEIVEVRS